MTREEKRQCKEIIYHTCVMANSLYGWGKRSIDNLAIQHFIINIIISIGEVFGKYIDDDAAHTIFDNVKERHSSFFSEILDSILCGDSMLGSKITSIGWKVVLEFDKE